MSPQAEDLIRDGDTIYYTYRGKGGKTGKRELPQPAYQAMLLALAVFRKDLATRQPHEPRWHSSSEGL